MKSYIKDLYHFLKGDRLKIAPTVDLQTAWYGNKYGGFYVYPNLLSAKSIVYSFGIGEDISFDLEIIRRHQCEVFGFDPTPRSIQWVNSQEIPKSFHFVPVGIDVMTGEVEFFLPKNNEHVSGSTLENSNIDRRKKISVRMMAFDDVIKDLKHQRVDVVKMDIEGAEYKILKSVLTSGIEIPQILIEFHHRMTRGGKLLTQNAIDLLFSHDYEIFGVSESGEEISFVKKKFIGS